VIGKTASSAAMALTFASYAMPGPWWAQRLVAVAAVLVLAGLNYRGVSKTAALTRILVTVTLTALAVVVAAIWVGGHARAANLHGWAAVPGSGVHGLLQAAGLLFFAFAGYARIATMGEEVRDPARTIPRAIPTALGIVVVVYLLVGVSALAGAGSDLLAQANAPLTAAVQAAGAGDVAPVVRIGGAVASLGALLALIAGILHTSLAMARNRDLPNWLNAVHPRYQVPHHAEVSLAVVVSALVLTTDLRGVIDFSSFGVLVYYGIANAAAFTQPREQRRWPRALNLLGILGCAVLVVSLPAYAILAGLVMFAIGLAGRVAITTWRNRHTLDPARP